MKTVLSTGEWLATGASKNLHKNRLGSSADSALISSVFGSIFGDAQPHALRSIQLARRLNNAKIRKLMVSIHFSHGIALVIRR